MARTSSKKQYPYPTSDDWMKAIGDAAIDRREKVVLWAMLRYLNRRTSLMWASKQTLGRDSGYTDRWISEACKSLQEREVISVVQASKGGSSGGRGLTNTYRVDYNRLRSLSRNQQEVGIESGSAQEVSSMATEVISNDREASSDKQAPTEQVDETKWVRKCLLTHLGIRDVDSIMNSFCHHDLAVALRGIIEQRRTGEIRSVGAIIRNRFLNRARRDEPAKLATGEYRDFMNRIKQQRTNHGVSQFRADDSDQNECS